MSSKQELIKAIQEEYVKLGKIDEDSHIVYDHVVAQLRCHGADPIVLAPLSQEVQEVRYLAKRYAEQYEAIAVLLEQLNVEQNRAGMEYRGWK